MICDETPTLDQERWEAILDLLIKEKMDLELLMETRVSDIVRDEAIMEKYREAGFVHIYVGVESAEQETLDKFKKNIKVEESRKAIELINKAGIISETSFVLGMPDETPGTIRQALELAKHYNPDLAFFLAIAPWPYSDIYSEIEPYIETKDYSQYNLIEPVARTKAMARTELRKSILKAFRDFYMWKLKQLDQMESFKRDYMLSVTELLATNSYLADQMKGMAKIPAQVAKILKRLPFKEKIAL
jgi:anaerobic magnesium-protoporphyrin IX monomethyl ester cyclase